MIKIEQHNGYYQATKEVKDLTSETLSKYLNEVKGYVKKKRKTLSYFGMDIFNGFNNQILICYFVEP